MAVLVLPARGAAPLLLPALLVVLLLLLIALLVGGVAPGAEGARLLNFKRRMILISRIFLLWYFFLLYFRVSVLPLLFAAKGDGRDLDLGQQVVPASPFFLQNSKKKEK